METVAVILFILVCFSFVLKQTFVHALQIGITAVAAMVFMGLAWRGAILQSSTEIAGWLADTDLVRDISVLLNIDVLMATAFCLLSADVEVAGRIGRKARLLFAFLRFFPGIMIIPMMFGILVETIFAFPGEDFSLIAWTLGAVFCIAIPLLTYVVKRLLPETFLRLELQPRSPCRHGGARCRLGHSRYGVAALAHEKANQANGLMARHQIK